MKEPHTVLLRQFFMGDEEADVIAFKEAGDELVDFIIRGQKYSWYDAFLRPIGLLYRHYLELEIKYWINELRRHYKTKRNPLLSSLIRWFFLHFSTNQKFAETHNIIKNHDLKKLWKKLKPSILPFCTGREEQIMLNDVEQVILLFHNYDPTGQDFRYTRTTKGKNTLSALPPKIDVESIRCSIAKVSDFFNGLSGIIDV